MSRTSEALGVSELLNDAEIAPGDAVEQNGATSVALTRVTPHSVVKIDQLPQPRRLTFRSPAEIVAMVFTDSDKIIGDRLIAQGQGAAWLGEAGIGKSRLITQACACVITGRDFIGLETANRDLRWLFIQSENSNRRLKKDLEKIHDWLGEADWLKFCAQVRFHTIETDDDGFISLDELENVLAIDAEIQQFQPGVVVFDPLNEMGGGDLNSDMEMRRTLRAITRLAKRGNPDRAVIILHHSLTGKAGASRATGYDRTSFGRNSKSLVAWARAQINIAPGSGDPTDGLLVIACGKCSNGRPFDRFAVRLNPDTMIYEPFPSFNWQEWEHSLSPNAKQKSRDADDVANLCGMPISQADLAKKIALQFGVTVTNAYRPIKAALRARKIRADKNGNYVRA